MLLFAQSKTASAIWSEAVLPMPVNVGTGKGVAVGDVDGDLDLLACEESEPVDGKRYGLGMFWYENPTGGK